jgi:hypothetical protein
VKASGWSQVNVIPRYSIFTQCAVHMISKSRHLYGETKKNQESPVMTAAPLIEFWTRTFLKSKDDGCTHEIGPCRSCSYLHQYTYNETHHDTINSQNHIRTRNICTPLQPSSVIILSKQGSICTPLKPWSITVTSGGETSASYWSLPYNNHTKTENILKLLKPHAIQTLGCDYHTRRGNTDLFGLLATFLLHITIHYSYASHN